MEQVKIEIENKANGWSNGVLDRVTVKEVEGENFNDTITERLIALFKDNTPFAPGDCITIGRAEEVPE